MIFNSVEILDDYVVLSLNLNWISWYREFLNWIPTIWLTSKLPFIKNGHSPNHEGHMILFPFRFVTLRSLMLTIIYFSCHFPQLKWCACNMSRFHEKNVKVWKFKGQIRHRKLWFLLRYKHKSRIDLLSYFSLYLRPQEVFLYKQNTVDQCQICPCLKPHKFIVFHHIIKNSYYIKNDHFFL